jgi:hypothetical protein
MDLATKLNAFKEMQDKDAAIDSAFLAGVQSVTPMREFAFGELRMMYDCITAIEEVSGRFEMTYTSHYSRSEIASRILDEIHRREEIISPYKLKKEAMKHAATNTLA